MPGDRVDLTCVLDGLDAATVGGAPRFVEACDGRALARLRLPSLRPPLDSGATAILVGKAAAIAAASTALGDAGRLRPDEALRAVELSVSLFRDAAAGVLTAEAETLFRGRSTVVVHVKVRDEQPGLVAALVVTQLAEPVRRAS
jgi:acyl-coenzyme A thioesterase PaaI-like protein